MRSFKSGCPDNLQQAVALGMVIVAIDSKQTGTMRHDDVLKLLKKTQGLRCVYGGGGVSEHARARVYRGCAVGVPCGCRVSPEGCSTSGVVQYPFRSIPSFLLFTPLAPLPLAIKLHHSTLPPCPFSALSHAPILPSLPSHLSLSFSFLLLPFSFCLLQHTHTHLSIAYHQTPFTTIHLIHQTPSTTHHPPTLLLSRKIYFRPQTQHYANRGKKVDMRMTGSADFQIEVSNVRQREAKRSKEKQREAKRSNEKIPRLL